MQLIEICSKKAFEILESVNGSYLIDVRTEYEWTRIGVPSLDNINKQVLFIPWPNIIDIGFVNFFLTKLKSKFNYNDKLFFICRSGSRSRMASQIAIENNFINCYNISDGFEGNNSIEKKNGWKSAELPWVFSKN